MTGIDDTCLDELIESLGRARPKQINRDVLRSHVEDLFRSLAWMEAKRISNQESSAPAFKAVKERNTHAERVAAACAELAAILNEPQSQGLWAFYDRHASIENAQGAELAKDHIFIEAPSVLALRQGLISMAEFLKKPKFDRREKIEGTPSGSDFFVMSAADVYEAHATGKIGLASTSPFARFCCVAAKHAGKKITGIQVKKSVGRWREAERTGAWPKHLKNARTKGPR